MSTWRDATTADLAALWPAMRSAHVMSAPEQLAAFSAEGPWRVRVAEDGSALVLRAWRAHLDVLAIRVAWAAAARVPAVVDEARRLAREHGFASVISPLLAEEPLQAYADAGMTPDRRLIAYQASPGAVLDALAVQATADVRPATEDDFAEIARLDARCFDEFWRYGVAELSDAFGWERMTVVEVDGRIGGYATCSVSGSACTLGRLAVDPELRRRGIASSLVADVAAYARARGALGLSLCTQEENEPSRALYVRAGFIQVGDVYAVASVVA